MAPVENSKIQQLQDATNADGIANFPGVIHYYINYIWPAFFTLLSKTKTVYFPKKDIKTPSLIMIDIVGTTDSY